MIAKRANKVNFDMATKGNNTNYDILFLSSMYPKECSEYYNSRGFKQGGQNVTFIQRALIEGIEAIEGCNCRIINKTLISSQSSCFVPLQRWRHNVNSMSEDISFAYINKPVFSSNLLFAFSRKHIDEWIDTTSSAKKIVIAYALTYHNLCALEHIKKRNSSIKTGIIVPDLPEHTKRNGKNLFLRTKNKLANYIIESKIESSGNFIDLYVLFAEKMKDALPCANKFTVVEGIATDSFGDIKARRIVSNGEISILYSGGLHRKYGVELLVNAFEMLEDDRFHLILCGSGDYVSEILAKAQKNGRIHYLGVIDRDTLLELQAGADVLVNPRTSDNIFSQYSFPSKNMEYLSSGVPFVGFKLGGIPDEYDSFISYPGKENAQMLAQCIYSVCINNRAFAQERAREAKRFVLETKNRFKQTLKIMDILIDD